MPPAPPSISRVILLHTSSLQHVCESSTARSTLHLANIFRLAHAADLLRVPEFAAARMRTAPATRGNDWASRLDSARAERRIVSSKAKSG